MLDDAPACPSTVLDRYGDVLPDSLVRTTVEAAPTASVAEADLAALADAALRASQARA